MVIDPNVNSLYSAKYHTNGFLMKQLSVIRNFTVSGGEEVTQFSVLQRDKGGTARAWQVGKVLAPLVESGSSRKLQVVSSTTRSDFLDKA